MLRDYQSDLLSKINEQLTYVNRVLAVAPTGAGKSLIIEELVKSALRKGLSVLVIVHRTKLMSQLSEQLNKSVANGKMNIVGSKKKLSRCNGYISMVQTLAKNEIPDVDMVIVDEAHSVSFFEVFDRVLSVRNPIWQLSNVKVVGLTATPWRTNTKEGFCRYFNRHVQTCSTEELIGKGYLTPVKFYKYDSTVDIGSLKSDSKGDFTSSSLQKVCNQKYLDDVISQWSKSFRHLKTIFFVSSVVNAQFLKQYISDSEIITGTTNKTERNRIFEAFKSGQCKRLINVNALTEGYDETSIECVVVARPTKSRALFVQMVGRGLRLHPGKHNVIILDFGCCLETFKHADRSINDTIDVRLCPQFRVPLEAKVERDEVTSTKQVLKLDLDLPPLVEVQSEDAIKTFRWLRTTFIHMLEKEELNLHKLKLRFFKETGKILSAFHMKGLVTNVDTEINRQFFLWALRELPERDTFYELEFGDAVMPMDEFNPIQYFGLNDDYTPSDINRAYDKMATVTDRLKNTIVASYLEKQIR